MKRKLLLKYPPNADKYWHLSLVYSSGFTAENLVFEVLIGLHPKNLLLKGFELVLIRDARPQLLHLIHLRM